MTGDGKADAIAVNDNTVTVRPSDGGKFLPNEDWTYGPYYGDRGTSFADVDGDKRADAIAVNSDTVVVRLSNGDQFRIQDQHDWTHGSYLGDKGIYFADATGDGKADAIVSNSYFSDHGVALPGAVTVRPSDGSEFLPNQDWIKEAYYGDLQVWA